MSAISNMTDAQLKSRLDNLKKISARTSDANAKAKFDAGIKDIEKEMAKRKKPTAKPTAKKEEKEEKPKAEPKPKPKPKPKPTAKKEEKEEKPSGKRTGSAWSKNAFYKNCCS